ncbi:hypothetical protein F5884DRAFT_810525 [Xylogone sp. PMI_703]|nr:hypothetical protein F5884DRAFT_810525 [Xylogone sp. PMI_703]
MLALLVLLLPVLLRLALVSPRRQKQSRARRPDLNFDGFCFNSSLSFSFSKSHSTPLFLIHATSPIFGKRHLIVSNTNRNNNIVKSPRTSDATLNV